MPEEHTAHEDVDGVTTAAVAANSGPVNIALPVAGMPAAEHGFSADRASTQPQCLGSLAADIPADTARPTAPLAPAMVPEPTGPLKAGSPAIVAAGTPMPLLTNGRLNNDAGEAAEHATPETGLDGTQQDVLPARPHDGSIPVANVCSSLQEAALSASSAQELLQQKAVQTDVQHSELPSSRQQSPPPLLQQQQQQQPSQQQVQMQSAHNQLKANAKSGLAQQRHSIIAAAAAAQREADALLTGIQPKSGTSSAANKSQETVPVSLPANTTACTPASAPALQEFTTERPAQQVVHMGPVAQPQTTRLAQSAAEMQHADLRKQKRRRLHELEQQQAHHLDLLCRVAAIAAQAQEIDSEVTPPSTCPDRQWRYC